MFYDPLQEKLREMEKINPSRNNHEQSFEKSLSDRVYFLGRYFKKDVKKKLTWSDLGVPLGMVDEHKEFENEFERYREFMSMEVPQELVERVVSDYTK